ncbi:MAG: B-box zinc finger protein [Polyangiales bacterium]|nr:B-box zinc finger protein [Myxococcales bacterium]MCB9657238.1 B-box zinc finger protein [Sandaracinaceae bacterium]
MNAHPAPRCPQHPDARAETPCTSCGRPLCAACWRFDVDERPSCAHCVEHLHDRSPAAFPLAFLGGTGTLLAALLLRFRDHPNALHVALGSAAMLLVTTAFLYRRGLQVASWRRIVERPEAEGRPHEDAQGAYRSAAHVRRLVAIVPPVSGELSTLVVLLALALPVAIAPGLLNVPAWLAIDATLLLWWGVFVLVFATLLYRGSRLAEDGPSLDDARPPEGEDFRRPRKKSSLDGCGDGCSGCSLDTGGCSSSEGCGSAGGEGVLGVLVVLIALAALVLLAWLLAEFVLPLLFTAAYYVVSRGLRRVANDTHDCQGDLVRSLGWAIAWATLYTAPLALVVVLVQGILAAR